jgi:hypothetical protein
MTFRSFLLASTALVFMTAVIFHRLEPGHIPQVDDPGEYSTSTATPSPSGGGGGPRVVGWFVSRDTFIALGYRRARS